MFDIKQLLQVLFLLFSRHCDFFALSCVAKILTKKASFLTICVIFTHNKFKLVKTSHVI